MSQPLDIDFEAWASLLLNRKVPQCYNHLITREVIRRGASILKDGGAFEVHVHAQFPNVPRAGAGQAAFLTGHVTVTQMPNRCASLS